MPEQRPGVMVGSIQQRSSEPSLCNVKQFYNYVLIKGVLAQL